MWRWVFPGALGNGHPKTTPSLTLPRLLVNILRVSHSKTSHYHLRVCSISRHNIRTTIRPTLSSSRPFPICLSLLHQGSTSASLPRYPMANTISLRDSTIIYL